MRINAEMDMEGLCTRRSAGLAIGLVARFTTGAAVMIVAAT
ncbi:hypothetical protein [Bradyrhizobium sp.]|nr:hypothetical protein [Bradyrhizobium sp.]